MLFIFVYLSSSEVPGFDVVVETNAFGAAILGNDFHDVFLLLWRKQVFTMMITIVGAKTTTKEKTYTTASFGPLMVWHMIIDVGEAPCFLDETLLAEIPAIAVLPGCRVDCWPVLTTFWQQQSGLIMHTAIVLCALIVEAQGISRRDVFVC